MMDTHETMYLKINESVRRSYLKCSFRIRIAQRFPCPQNNPEDM